MPVKYIRFYGQEPFQDPEKPYGTYHLAFEADDFIRVACIPRGTDHYIRDIAEVNDREPGGKPCRACHARAKVFGERYGFKPTIRRPRKQSKE